MDEYTLLVSQALGFEGFSTVAIVVTLIMGLLSCYFGYSLFKLQCALMGFLLGVGVGLAVMVANPDLIWLGVVLMLGLGLLLAILAIKFYFLGVFLVVGLWGFVLLSLLTQNQVVGLVAGVLLGVAGAILARPMIILSTALSGGTTAASAIVALIGGQPLVWLFILLSVAFAGTGLVTQFKMTAQAQRAVYVGPRGAPAHPQHGQAYRATESNPESTPPPAGDGDEV